MNAEAEGRAMAVRFRRDHHLGTQPLGDLAALIDQTTGIDVAVLDAAPDEHGLTMRDPGNNSVFIGVARTKHPMRQRSTLAHELGHVLFEDWTDDDVDDWSDRRPEEIRADAFARHLLIPVEGVRELLTDRNPADLSTLSEVVQRFLVSPKIAAIAIRQAGEIDDETKQKWMSQSTSKLATRFGWDDQYRTLRADSDQRRTPRRLLSRAVRAYEEGVLSAQVIATLRRVSVETAEVDLREAGITPTAPDITWAPSAHLPDVHIDLAQLDSDLNTTDESSNEQPGPITQ